MTYITRQLESEIKAFIDSPLPNKEVLLVEGARQVGKSTLVNHVLDASSRTSVRVNLEKHPSIRSKIDSTMDFDDFSAYCKDELHYDPEGGTILFIDEAQESLKLGGFVRFMKEEWRNATVILSGSTLSRLFRNDTRYPVGRIRRCTVTPLSFAEFLRAAGDAHLEAGIADPAGIPLSRHEYLLGRLDEYYSVGGLPSVVTDFMEGKDWRSRRTEILADLEQDMLRILGEETFSIASSCLRSVAHFVGNPAKNTTIVSDMHPRLNQKINDVFSRLESWHFVILCRQFGVSAEHSYGYHPKRYLFDTGILRHLREIAVPSLRLLEQGNPQARTLIGGIIENQVAIDLTRNGGTVSGWRKTSSGNDIDFIIKIEGTSWPMECKASLTLKGTHLRGVIDYARYYGLVRGFIASGAPFEIRSLDDGIRIINIPLYSAEFAREIIARETAGLAAGNATA